MRSSEKVVFQTLLQSESSYAREFKEMCSSIVKLNSFQILNYLIEVRNMLLEPRVAYSRKCLAIWFVKDTLLLANYTFYMLSLITILPILASIYQTHGKQTQLRLDCVEATLKGRPTPIEQNKVINLVDEIITWFGQQIRYHPYGSFQYASAFNMLAANNDTLRDQPFTHFTTTDKTKYYHSYIHQKKTESKFCESTQNMINKLVTRHLHYQNGQDIYLLKGLVQTGDTYTINNIIQNLLHRLKNQKKQFADIFKLITQLVQVGEVEFLYLSKVQLLPTAYQVAAETKDDLLVEEISKWANTHKSVLGNSEAYEYFLQSVGLSYGINSAHLKLDSDISIGNILGLVDEINAQKMRQLPSCREADIIQKMKQKKRHSESPTWTFYNNHSTEQHKRSSQPLQPFRGISGSFNSDHSGQQHSINDKQLRRQLSKNSFQKLTKANHNPASLQNRQGMDRIVGPNESSQEIDDYLLVHHKKAPDQAEPLKKLHVEPTLFKPKFAFTEPKIDISNYQLEQPKGISIELESLRQDHLSNYSQVPSDFGNCLQVPTKGNHDGYYVKMQELKSHIQQAKQRNNNYEAQLKQKEYEISKLKRNMPNHPQQLIQTNKQLTSVLKQKVSPKASHNIIDSRMMLKSAYPIYHLNTKPYSSKFVKQLIYQRCILQKAPTYELSMAIKNQEIGLYFKFVTACAQLQVQLNENSLVLLEKIDTTVYDIPKDKQLKLKSKISDYRLINKNKYDQKDYDFVTANLSISLTSKTKLHHQQIHVQFPFCLLNFLKFSTPSRKIIPTYMTNWKLGKTQLVKNSEQFLKELFPYGKAGGQGYMIVMSEKYRSSRESEVYRVVVNGKYFCIEGERQPDESKLLLKMLISLLKKEEDTDGDLVN